MEISLKKIELVKDRTGVSYKEAKEALLKKDGNVLDAIILLEDEIDITPQTKAENGVSKIVEAVKDIVKKGNVSKILVKRNGEVVVNIPVNIGLLGLIVEPWAMLLATLLSLGMKCSIDIVKNDGEVINVSEKASETFSGVKEKGSDAFLTMKDQASSALNKVKRNKSSENLDDDEIEIEIYEVNEDEGSCEDEVIDVYSDEVKEKDKDREEEADIMADGVEDAVESFDDAVKTYKEKN